MGGISLTNIQIEELLRIFAKYDCCEILSWTIDDDDKLIFFINCNDVFAWGCSDAVDIEVEDFDLIRQTFEDIASINKFLVGYAYLLICARKLKLRPQGAVYRDSYKDLWPLLDACGPEREIDIGNPYKPGEYNR